MQESVSAGTQPAGGNKTAEPHERRLGGSFFSFINLLTLALILGLAIYPDWPVGLRLALGAMFLSVITVGVISSYAPILSRCILPLLIGGICVEAYILLQHSDFSLQITKYFVFDDKYNEIFYSGVATLYAIITALALVKGIEDFDSMKRNITDEAYKVRAIFAMTHYFDVIRDGETRDAILGIRQKLLRYAENAAAMRDQRLRNENLRILRDCQSDIARLKPRDENDRHSLQIIVAAHGELGTLRSKRINAVGEKIPRYLIAALWLMAVSLILPFMGEPLFIKAPEPAIGLVANPGRFGQYYIIFLMGALNSFLLLMLSDISDPFDGFWKVTLDPFDELRLALGHEIAEEAEFESAATRL
jgi:hypothetical protein